MTPLTPPSLAALARLAAYKAPQPSVWTKVHHSRRAAVLVLLFKDACGGLRCVVTMRGGRLRNYANQAAFPGGHADTLLNGLSETPIQTARREAFEEICLPLPRSMLTAVTSSTSPSQPTSSPPQPTSPDADDTPDLPAPWKIAHLCELPTYLAKTCLGVKPCVAFIGDAVDLSSLQREQAERSSAGIAHSNPLFTQDRRIPSTPILSIPADSTEVSAIFSTSLSDCLSASPSHSSRPQAGSKEQWYTSSPLSWHTPARRVMHSFSVPTAGQEVCISNPPDVKPNTSGTALASPRPSSQSLAELGKESQKDILGEESERGSLFAASNTAPPFHLRVHGLTALLLLDVARIAYGTSAGFPHTPSFGDEDIIESLLASENGLMSKARQHGEEFVGDREGTIGRKKREARCRSVDEWLKDREGEAEYGGGNKL